MKRAITSILAVGLALIAGPSAFAFSEDGKSMTDANGQARFSDPDERTPSAGMNLHGANDRGDVDPSSVRYDYDPDSGGYVAHKR